MDITLSIAAVLIAAFLLSLTPPGVNFRRRMMARFYDQTMEKYEPHVAERKRQLMAKLSGTVLELGPGTGANFPHLPERVERWIGIEPNPHMHASLRAAAQQSAVVVEFRNVTAERMEVSDASVDAVVSTLVLCSVPDPAAVVRDVHRVLRPGGQFVFLEHVAAPRGTRLRRWQRRLRPIWRYMADGCHPDRELRDVIAGAGFDRVDVSEFQVPADVLPALVSLQISGVAVKREA